MENDFSNHHSIYSTTSCSNTDLSGRLPACLPVPYHLATVLNASKMKCSSPHYSLSSSSTSTSSSPSSGDVAAFRGTKQRAANLSSEFCCLVRPGRHLRFAFRVALYFQATDQIRNKPQYRRTTRHPAPGTAPSVRTAFWVKIYYNKMRIDPQCTDRIESRQRNDKVAASA